MVKQVVRSQTSCHADCDLTKDFFRCICKRSQSSVLGLKKNEMVKQVVRSQTSYHGDCDLTKDFSVVFVKGHNCPF